MKQIFSLIGIVVLSFFTSCQQQQDPLMSICKNATAESYDLNFKVWCPSQEDDYFIPVRYGCLPEGKGISPPISWSGVPAESTHLRVIVEDATCTYMCDPCCKYHHWVLDFPISELSSYAVITQHGIMEGASKNPLLKEYTLPNSSNKREYMPFCPPKIQTHAYVYKLIAYKKDKGKITVTGRSQSMPLLFSLEGQH